MWLEAQHYFRNFYVTIMCRNDEVSWRMSWLGCLLTYSVLPDKQISGNNRRVWLFSANNIKSSETFSKQRTQLIIAAAEIRHINFHLLKNLKISFIIFSIRGGELFDRVIEDEFVLTEKACVCFMRQVLEGVSFIHSKHILHLDLKVSHFLEFIKNTELKFSFSEKATKMCAIVLMVLKG